MHQSIWSWQSLAVYHSILDELHDVWEGNIEKSQHVGNTSPDKVEALVAFDFKRESALKKHF